jgi:hypothetical protein
MMLFGVNWFDVFAVMLLVATGVLPVGVLPVGDVLYALLPPLHAVAHNRRPKHAVRVDPFMSCCSVAVSDTVPRNTLPVHYL